MSQGFEDQVEKDYVSEDLHMEVPQEEVIVSEVNPPVVENIYPPPDLEVLCKGHGKIEVVSGEKRLVGHKGYILVSSPESLMVVSSTTAAAEELRDKLQNAPGVIVADETHTLVPVALFNKVKRAIRMKRNISEESREKKRQRMRDFWARKKAAPDVSLQQTVSEVPSETQE